LGRTFATLTALWRLAGPVAIEEIAEEFFEGAARRRLRRVGRIGAGAGA
jgi:hypothetical protein